MTNSEPAKHSFSRISRLSPTQQVQNEVFAAITRGEYPPGAYLPSERILGEMFGVSRASIREALAGLAATGVIEIRQGSGALVRLPASDEYAGPFGLYIEMHRDELGELLRIRGALDGLAAAQAATNIASDMRNTLRAAHDDFKVAAEAEASPQELAELDIELHQAIAKAGAGSLLPNLLGELNSLLVESRHILFAQAGQPQRSISDHEAIIRAISDGDRQVARDRASQHVENMWSWIEKFKSRKT